MKATAHRAARPLAGDVATGRPTAEAPGHVGAAAPEQMVEELAGRPMVGPMRALFVAAALVSTLLVLNQLLNLQLFAGVVFIENRYLYILAALLFPLTTFGAAGLAARLSGAARLVRLGPCRARPQALD